MLRYSRCSSKYPILPVWLKERYSKASSGFCENVLKGFLSFAVESDENHSWIRWGISRQQIFVNSWEFFVTNMSGVDQNNPFLLAFFSLISHCISFSFPRSFFRSVWTNSGDRGPPSPIAHPKTHQCWTAETSHSQLLLSRRGKGKTFRSKVTRSCNTCQRKRGTNCLWIILKVEYQPYEI